MENSYNLSKNQKFLTLSILPIMFILVAFLFDKPSAIINGLYEIIVTPDLLLTDYIAIGGLGATLVNSSILILINLFILYKLDIKLSGLALAAIFTIGGFAFFGKNIVNVWPIYIGGLLYCRYKKITFNNIVLIIMFGTALAPMVSQIANGTSLPVEFGILLGVALGLLAGFVLPVLAPHMLHFHDGYNLYNIGFTAGIVGTVLISILRGYGIDIETQRILSVEYDLVLKVVLALFCFIFIFIGYFINGQTFKGYKNLISLSGRVVTDFVQSTSLGLTFINMGIMGLVSVMYVIISRGIIDGPVIGGILTVIGFSAFGKHPRNTIPIFIGVSIGSLTNIFDIGSTGVIITALFGTTLAPLAGEYGVIVGILTGFIHLSVVMNVGVIHGGINLYNNGFAGGIVAGVLSPIMNAFYKDVKIFTSKCEKGGDLDE